LRFGDLGFESPLDAYGLRKFPFETGVLPMELSAGVNNFDSKFIMATITRFEDLIVWQQARVLATRVFDLYSTLELFKKDYKLKDQINGSSGSVMDNIAEGFNRGSTKEFINFLSYAKGSVGEVKSQLYRAFDRRYITEEILHEMYGIADQVAAKIAKLTTYLNGCLYKGLKFKGRDSLQIEPPDIPISDIEFPENPKQENNPPNTKQP